MIGDGVLDEAELSFENVCLVGKKKCLEWKSVNLKLRSEKRSI